MIAIQMMINGIYRRRLMNYEQLMEPVVERDFQNAIRFAVDKHAGQYRKHSGAPYIVHPLEVVKRLGLWGVGRDKNPGMWCAAILHDITEDCGVSIEEIRGRFGLMIALFVDDLTYREGIETKEEYLDSFREKRIGSLVIKLADRICNIEDYDDVDVSYAEKYLKKSLPLFDVFHERRVEIESRFGEHVAENIGDVVWEYQMYL